MKSKRLTFNKWLSAQTPESPHYQLAALWKVTRGRLTRESVLTRAELLGFPGRVGLCAWDAYVLALENSPSTSEGSNTSPQDPS